MIMSKIWKKHATKYAKNTGRNCANYYKSIDELPLHNWVKCTGGDLRFVRIDLSDGNEQNDVEYWENIFDSYINEFGLSKMHNNLLKGLKKKAEFELKYVLTNDRFILTKLEVEIEKIKVMINNRGSGITIEQSLVHLSKWIGNWIDSKKITAREYFNLQKEFERANK